MIAVVWVSNVLGTINPVHELVRIAHARIAEAETAIGKTRDAAMTNVAKIAADTAAAIVERLTGKAPSAAEADAAVKGAA